MPRPADKTDTPERLTQAGFALFSQQGFNATGIQQITDTAGVPKGSFYNHFDSKEAFAAEVIRTYARTVDLAWDAAVQQAPPGALPTIRHVFARFTQHHEDKGCQGCLVGNFAAEVAESSALCCTEMRMVMRHWQARLAALIERAQAEGDIRRDLPPQALARIFWDAWEGAVLRTKIDHHTQALKDTAAMMLDKFFRP